VLTFVDPPRRCSQSECGTEASHSSEAYMPQTRRNEGRACQLRPPGDRCENCATTDHSVSRDVRHQCLALGRTALVAALQSPITKTVLVWAPFGFGFGELLSRKCVALHTTADFGLPRASSARANETHCSESLIASSASSYTRPKGIRST